jgi:hypothetical protein
MRAAAGAGAGGRSRPNGRESGPCGRRAGQAVHLRPQPALPGARAHPAGHNGLDLLDAASPLQIARRRLSVSEVLVTARIGINEAVDWPLRFALPGSTMRLRAEEFSPANASFCGRIPSIKETISTARKLPFETFFPVFARCRNGSADRGCLCRRHGCPGSASCATRGGSPPPPRSLSRAHQPEGAAQGSDRAAGPRDHGKVGGLAGRALQHLPHGGPQQHRPQRTPAAQLCRRLQAGEE